MANKIYPKYKQALLTADSGADVENGNVKAVLVDLADYTYSASHEFLSDVPSGARVSTSANFASKTITNGTFDSADFAFTAVTGDQAEALILYVDSGSAATSRLIIYYDTGVSGFPITPSSGDINVTVNASGWFAL